MTVPGYCWRCCSSQSIDSASRWLVGSSSSSTSGCCSNRRQRATRRRSPPDSVATFWSSGGHWRASMARSSFESMFHASAASRASCSSPWRRMRASILSGFSSTSGSPKAALTSSNSLRRSMTGCTPSRTISITVFEGSSLGSCSR